MEANRKANQEDKDGDGVADLDQIDTTELLWRKVDLVKSVDPDRITPRWGLYAFFFGRWWQTMRIQRYLGVCTASAPP